MVASPLAATVVTALLRSDFFVPLNPKIIGEGLVLGSCRAGVAWKTAKGRKWGKMENQMENNPQLDTGKQKLNSEEKNPPEKIHPK